MKWNNQKFEITMINMLRAIMYEPHAKTDGKCRESIRNTSEVS